jgi:hypothetical protein
MGGLPIGVATSGDIPDDVKDILGGEGHARERATGHPFQVRIRIFAKGV